MAWAATSILAAAAALFYPGRVSTTQASVGPIQRPFVYQIQPSEGQDLDIFLADPSTSAHSQLAGSGFDEYSPALSPDGKQVAFVRNQDGDADILVVGSNGAGVRPLTSGPATDGGPRWSSDGSMVVFWRDNGTGHPDIYVIGANGQGERRLTFNDYVDVQPAWSPDGKTIAFVRNTEGTSNLFLVDIATGADRQLTTGGGFRLPVWSPDGSQIAAVETESSDSSQDVMAVSPSTGAVIPIKRQAGAWVTSLGWAPEGIIYSSAGPDLAMLTTFVIDPGTGTTLASGVLEGEPSW